jgi:putative sterol carrier protein
MSKNSFRDLTMGMVKAFDPSVVPSDLVADIQFHVSGKEPGDYYLHVEDGKCTFHEGVSKSPKITINTPSEVWVAIAKGELDVQQAFFDQKFTVEGDLMLMLQLRSIFKQD